MGPTTGQGGQGYRARGSLLLADISGYTGFLQGVADAHRDLIIDADEPPAAYSLVSSLLDTIVTTISPSFRLAKFEGDAVFAVPADGAAVIRGADVVACLRGCHAAFTAALAAANTQWTCTCNSCARIHELDLKFVLHHGDYVVQRVAGQEELLGPDVNTVHRLLKNHVVELIGARPYALLTDRAIRELEVPADGMVPATETYDHMPPVEVHVLPLGQGVPLA